MKSALIKRIEVQVDPQWHMDGMKHYWRVFTIDAQGNTFTVKDGWSNTFYNACDTARYFAY